MRSRIFVSKIALVWLALTSWLILGAGHADAAGTVRNAQATTAGITYVFTGADGFGSVFDGNPTTGNGGAMTGGPLYGGEWEDPSNWIPYGVPETNDTAIVGSAIYLDNNPVVASLQLVPDNAAGVADGGGALYASPYTNAGGYVSVTVTGSASWTAGTIQVPLAVGNGATLTIQPATGNECSIQGGVLINDGTVIIASGGTTGLNLGDGLSDENDFGFVLNDGTILLRPGASIGDVNPGSGGPRGLVFNDAGALVDSRGSTGVTTTIATGVQNLGTMSADYGTLSIAIPANDLIPYDPTQPQYAPPYYIAGNPAPANDATLTAASGAEVVDNGLPLDSGSVIAGAGTVAGVNVQINAPVEVNGNLEIDGAIGAANSLVQGPGTAVWKSGPVTGTLTFGPDSKKAATTATWTGGALNGDLVVLSGQTLTLPPFASTAAAPNYANRACQAGIFTNFGNVVQVQPSANQSSDLTIGQDLGTAATNVKINNNGAWTVETGTSISLDVNDPNNYGVFTNYGKFIKIGTSYAKLTIPFVNNTVVDDTAGTLDFAGGYTQNAGNLNLAGGNLAGPITLVRGVLFGTGSINGNVTNSGGTVCPLWPAVGTLTVTGNYIQGSSGTLAVSLEGTGAGQHGQLSVGGTATLGGAISPYLVNSYLPPAGAVYPTVTAASVVNTFSAVNSPLYGSGQALRALYTGTGVNLQAASRDYTVSGTVTRWQNGGGTSPVAGVTVGIWRPGSYLTTVTDVNGAYAFHNLAAGTYILDALKTGSIFSPANATTVVPNSGYGPSPDSVVNFSTYLISGQVLAAVTGNPGVANVTVNLTAVTASAVTDASGSFSFPDVPPGNYTLTPVPTGGLTFAPTNLAFPLPTTGYAVSPNAFVTFQASGAAGSAKVVTGPSAHSG